MEPAGAATLRTWPQITSGPCTDDEYRPVRAARCAGRLDDDAAAALTCLMKACASMGGGTMMFPHIMSRHMSLVWSFASGGRNNTPSAPAAASFSSAAAVRQVTSPPRDLAAGTAKASSPTNPQRKSKTNLSFSFLSPFFVPFFSSPPAADALPSLPSSAPAPASSCSSSSAAAGKRATRSSAAVFRVAYFQCRAPAQLFDLLMASRSKNE